ncbi:MAG: T9SS C-terminal target domain-containing protein, partial [Bacteroidetes bacterium]|nr:T9SS C-terminal target domain-containing protein [Bacteroidota bacterium]
MFDFDKQTADSGFVMGGFSSSPISGDKTEHSNYRDYFVLKVDKNGIDEWQNTIWANGEEWIQELQQTNDGYILGGYSSA